MERMSPSKYRGRGQAGLTLVEFMVVTIVLCVLMGIAAPIYANTRRHAAARACRANIAAIAAAQSAHALFAMRYNRTPMNRVTDNPPGLVGAPRGLSRACACPLGDVNRDGVSDAYVVKVHADNSLTIACPNAALHAALMPPASGYSRRMPRPSVEEIP